MNYYDIQCLAQINEVDGDKVDELVTSMLENGWQGAPILAIPDSMLVTGSHRIAALRTIWDRYNTGEYEDNEVLEAKAAELLNNDDIAYDVTDLVEDAFQSYRELNDEEPEFDFDEIGWIFEGTEVEKWKSEIAEW